VTKLTPTFSALTAITAVLALAPTPSARASADLKGVGAFGFPQKDAKVLCDTPELRVSVFNDAAYLFVQAVLWTDDSDGLGDTDDGRKIGDSAVLTFDIDGDGQPTADKDRSYSLDPWPSRAGLYYQIAVAGGSTPLKDDSKGRGSIAYVPSTGEKKVRVDTFLIPLAEIGRKPGDKLRLAYWAGSPKPELTLNSIGFKSDKKYYAHALPYAQYHELTLAERPTSIAANDVPDGRSRAAAPAEPKPMPAAGSEPPAIAATAWFNWTGDKPPTLKGLHGKVVAVEFWATWCGPCVAGIPHLSALHEKYGKEGLVILSLSDQEAKPIEQFIKDKSMKYAVGAGSQAFREYGITGIPHAYLIGRDGKVLWHGHPADEAFEKGIAAALKAK
jgi:thiol-disulfide isomerase/thioredoxin